MGEQGFDLMGDGLYVRSPELRCALPIGGCNLEVGNLHKQLESHDGLQPGHATIEVLCARPSVFGNPFILKKARNEQMRQLVCDAFDTFLTQVLDAETEGSLVVVAEAVAQHLGFRASVVNKEYLGCRSCESFRDSFQALRDLSNQHAGSLRLLCHCAP